MTTMKKLVSLILAVMMLLSVCAVANAEEATTYTITITGDTGHTYEAYQIFTGDLAGNVLSNIVLGDGVTDQVLTVGGTTYTSAAELADALTSENLAAFTEVVAANLADVAGTSTEVDGTYTISGLEPGYYFIKDKDDSVPAGDAYTKFIVKIVKNITATPKTDKTTHEKKVKENIKYDTNADSPNGYDYGTHYNDVADYCIGGVVPFSLYSKVPDMTYYTTYQMTFHDKMSEGLTFSPDSVKVYVGTTELTKDTDFTLTTACDDGCTFEVKINNLKNYAKGTEVRVDYSATLNENAVVGLDGNTNQSKLEFSNNPNDESDTTETPWDYVVVFTYELDVTKVDGENNELKLKDAEFVLKNSGDQFVTVDANGKVTGWVSNQEDASVLKSDANGNFKVIGLDDGTYKLVETKAPEGYNLLTAPIEIVITGTTANGQNYANVPADALTALEIQVGGTKATGDTDTGVVEAIVENNVGTTLPETGGIGTTIFYAVGGLLVVLAVVLLVTKRRVGEEN